MAGTKPGFMMYHKDLRILAKLDGDVLKRILMAMCDYSEHGTEPLELEVTERVLFEMFRESLDRDNDNYQRKVESARAAGRKSGENRKRSKANENERALTDVEKSEKNERALTDVEKSEANSSKPKQTERTLKKTKKSQANEPITNNQSPIPNSQYPTPNPISLSCAQESGERENFIPPTLEMVQAYARERGFEVDAAQFIAVNEQRRWKDSWGRPVRDWQMWLDGYVRSGAGRLMAAHGSKVPTALNFEQRSYQESDMDHVFVDLTKYMEGGE